MVFKLNEIDESKLVVAGRVKKAFGIRGQLTVGWFNGNSPVPSGDGSIYLKEKGSGRITRFVLVADHVHGKSNIITLEGLGTRTDAEKFRNCEILVELDKLPALKSDEYYCYQLIDMRVESTEGEYLGEIKEIFSTGSNDVYVVRNENKELLVPAIKDVIKEINVEKRIMKIELIEGLR